MFAMEMEVFCANAYENKNLFLDDLLCFGRAILLAG